MNIREISDVFKDTANQITAIKSYNFGWPSDRTRSSNTEDYQELNEFPRVFFSVPTITGSDQTRKQDTYQVTLFFDDLLGYNNEGDADLTLQLDKWATLQEYANYFVQRLNKVKQSILPNYLFIPEAPSITFDSFTGLQRMITVQLSFTLVVPTNCEPVVSKLVECIANIVTSSNLTASLTSVIKLVSSLQASSSLSASVLVSKLAQSNLNTESSLAANIQIAKLASSSLNAGSTLSAEALITRLFEASLNGNGSLFANPLITKFAASSLNANARLAASALVSKLAASSLTGAGTLAAELTVTGSATLLLDLYPDAAVAYSLRKLRTAYTGSAIRVRRSSDNTEQDIGFVADQLDTVSLLAFCGVGNGFVQTWYDQSGNANHGIQQTQASQPQIVNSGVIILSGSRPSVKFDGTNDFLLLTTTIANVNINSSFYNSYVGERESINKALIFNSSTLNGGDFHFLHWTDNKFYLGGSPTKNFNSSLINTNVTLSLMTGQNNNNGLSIHFNSNIINGVLIDSVNTRRINSIGRYTSVYTNGKLSESVLYLSNQSLNRTGIETNINTNYGIY